MKKSLFVTFVLVSFLSAKAQQEIQSSQFMLNPFLLNPAYSSVDDNTDLKMGYRNQWQGLEGAPITQYISLHGPVGKPRFGRTHPGDFHNWHGAGGIIMRDQIGAYTNTRINANYSYNVKLTDGTEYGYNHHDGLRLAFGAFLGWNSFNVNTVILGEQKQVGLGNEEFIPTTNDPAYQAIQANSDFRSKLDFSFGGMLYYEDAFYLGVSSTQLLESDINLATDANFSRHYFVTGLAKLQASEDLYIIPSAIMKMVNGAPMSANFNVRADWRDNYYAGIGYRTGDAFTFMLGAQIRWGEEVKHFRVSKNRYMMYLYYSYDATISALRSHDNVTYSNGSHEITLGFLLPPRFQERNAEDTWKGFKKGKRGKNRKHFLKTVF